MGRIRLDGGFKALKDFSPGRRCWQTPGPAAGRPPWPPRCPSSRHTLSPTRGTRSSPPAPPLGPHRGFGPRSGAAVERKEGKIATRGRQVDAPLYCPQSPFPQGRGSCRRHRSRSIAESLLCAAGIVPGMVFCIRSPSPTPPQASWGPRSLCTEPSGQHSRICFCCPCAHQGGCS